MIMVKIMVILFLTMIETITAMLMTAGTMTMMITVVKMVFKLKRRELLIKLFLDVKMLKEAGNSFQQLYFDG